MCVQRILFLFSQNKILKLKTVLNVCSYKSCSAIGCGSCANSGADANTNKLVRQHHHTKRNENFSGGLGILKDIAVNQHGSTLVHARPFHTAPGSTLGVRYSHSGAGPEAATLSTSGSDSQDGPRLFQSRPVKQLPQYVITSMIKNCNNFTALEKVVRKYGHSFDPIHVSAALQQVVTILREECPPRTLYQDLPPGFEQGLKSRSRDDHGEVPSLRSSSRGGRAESLKSKEADPSRTEDAKKDSVTPTEPLSSGTSGVSGAAASAVPVHLGALAAYHAKRPTEWRDIESQIRQLVQVLALHIDVIASAPPSDPRREGWGHRSLSSIVWAAARLVQDGGVLRTSSSSQGMLDLVLKTMPHLLELMEAQLEVLRSGKNTPVSTGQLQHRTPLEQRPHQSQPSAPPPTPTATSSISVNLPLMGGTSGSMPTVTGSVSGTLPLEQGGTGAVRVPTSIATGIGNPRRSWQSDIEGEHKLFNCHSLVNSLYGIAMLLERLDYSLPREEVDKYLTAASALAPYFLPTATQHQITSALWGFALLNYYDPDILLASMRAVAADPRGYEPAQLRTMMSAYANLASSLLSDGSQSSMEQQQQQQSGAGSKLKDHLDGMRLHIRLLAAMAHCASTSDVALSLWYTAILAVMEGSLLDETTIKNVRTLATAASKQPLSAYDASAARRIYGAYTMFEQVILPTTPPISCHANSSSGSASTGSQIMTLDLPPLSSDLRSTGYRHWTWFQRPIGQNKTLFQIHQALLKAGHTASAIGISTPIPDTPIVADLLIITGPNGTPLPPPKAPATLPPAKARSLFGTQPPPDLNPKANHTTVDEAKPGVIEEWSCESEYIESVRNGTAFVTAVFLDTPGDYLRNVPNQRCGWPAARLAWLARRNCAAVTQVHLKEVEACASPEEIGALIVSRVQAALRERQKQ